MKKWLSILFCSILMFSLTVPAWADSQEEPVTTVPFPTEKRDSSDIDPAILSELDLPGGAQAVYVYGRWIANALAAENYTGIDSVLGSEHSLGYDNVVVFAHDSVMTTYVINTKGEKTGQIRYEPDYNHADKLIREYLHPSAIYRVAEDIQIRASYVIADAYAHDLLLSGNTGGMIFYETDLGNYIYLLIGTAEFLMPEAGITPFATDYYNVIKEAKGVYFTVSFDADTYALLSQYSIHSKNFSLKPKTVLDSPWFWGGVGLVVITAASAFVILRKKHRKKENAE